MAANEQVLLMAGYLKIVLPEPLPGFVLKIEVKYKSQMRNVPPGAKAHEGAFPKRNRIIAALARVTIVVEANQDNVGAVVATAIFVSIASYLYPEQFPQGV